MINFILLPLIKLAIQVSLLVDKKNANKKVSKTTRRDGLTKAIRELSSSDIFLKSVVENIPHMIFVKDAKELRFVMFNKAGKELLGYDTQDLIGKNDYDFFPKQEADFFTKKDREVLEKGELFDIPQEPIHTRNKGTRILHTQKIPIWDENGKPLYLLGISEDVTEKIEVLNLLGREQVRIGQDLHDGLGQDLTAISLKIKTMEKKLQAYPGSDLNFLKDIANLVSQSIQKTRSLARGLHPVELESNGLVSALKELALNTESLYDIPCKFLAEDEFTVGDYDIATHIFRLAQEAVHNAAKHANPSHIKIELSSKEDKLVLKIIDDGVGIPSDVWQQKNGMGLHIMTYRAKMIGGEFGVTRNKTKGTTVECRWPR